MSELKIRKTHSADLKAKVGLEAMKGTRTANEIGQQYGVHPTMVNDWKKIILEQSRTLFDVKRGTKPAEKTIKAAEEERLYGEIGRLKMELDWLKKKSGF